MLGCWLGIRFLKMLFNILTIFPSLFDALDHGVIGKAKKNGKFSIMIDCNFWLLFSNIFLNVSFVLTIISFANHWLYTFSLTVLKSGWCFLVLECVEVLIIFFCPTEPLIYRALAQSGLWTGCTDPFVPCLAVSLPLTMKK